MNQEQNTPGNAGNDEELSKGFNPDKGEEEDDYYAVDNPKKDVISTIGDGEMHDEGLVGAGDLDDENAFSEGSTDAQDGAEFHDSEQ